MLFAAGLITGEALMGILLAMPIAVGGIWPTVSPDPVKLFDVPPLGAWPGVLAVGVVAYWLYKVARSSR